MIEYKISQSSCNCVASILSCIRATKMGKMILYKPHVKELKELYV